MDWPLCNGKFVPAYTLESMIEYTHRATTGIVGLMVVAVFIWVWLQLKEQKDAKLYAAGALFFTILQAILGAIAVKWEQSSAVLALHFGVSLLAFASTFLLVTALWRKNQKPQKKVRVPGSFRNFVWFIAIYCYFVVYLGAFIRHTKSAGGCYGWPLCNGEFIPEFSGATGIVFFHRLAAATLFLLIVWMTVVAVKNRYTLEIRVSSIVIFALVSMQVASGAWLTKTVQTESIFIFTSLLHTAIISCLFAMLCYLAFRLFQMKQDDQH